MDIKSSQQQKTTTTTHTHTFKNKLNNMMTYTKLKQIIKIEDKQKKNTSIQQIII